MAAALITAACLYKYTRTYDPSQFRLPDQRCPAATFDFPKPLTGQLSSQPVKLQSLVGRHRVIIVFFDGDAGAEADSFLVRLRTEHEQLQRANIKVLGISTAVPSQNRPPKPGQPGLPNQPKEAFPFSLLIDFAPGCIVHKLWGRYDYEKQKPRTGVFAIDEVGTVLCDGELPKPLAAPNDLLDEWLEK